MLPVVCLNCLLALFDHCIFLHFSFPRPRVVQENGERLEEGEGAQHHQRKGVGRAQGAGRRRHLLRDAEFRRRRTGGGNCAGKGNP